jgi:hypothetical protein
MYGMFAKQVESFFFLDSSELCGLEFVTGICCWSPFVCPLWLSFPLSFGHRTHLCLPSQVHCMPPTRQSQGLSLKLSVFATTCTRSHGLMTRPPRLPSSYPSSTFFAVFPYVRSPFAPTAILGKMHGLFSTRSLTWKKWEYGVCMVHRASCKVGLLCWGARSQS